jgi:hypothetical protein
MFSKRFVGVNKKISLTVEDSTIMIKYLLQQL